MGDLLGAIFSCAVIHREQSGPCVWDSYSVCMSVIVKEVIASATADVF